MELLINVHTEAGSRERRYEVVMYFRLTFSVTLRSFCLVFRCVEKSGHSLSSSTSTFEAQISCQIIHSIIFIILIGQLCGVLQSSSVVGASEVAVVTVGISSTVERDRFVCGLVGDSVVRESFCDLSVLLISSGFSASSS